MVDYDIETIVDLSNVFQGQNVKTYLNINGVFPIFNFSGPNYVPAIKWPQMSLTDHYEGDPDEIFLFHSVIKNSNKIIVTSTTQGLLVFNLTDTPIQMGMDSPDMPI